MGKISRRSVVTTLLSAAAVGVTGSGTAKAEDQPHMRAAVDLLRNAQRELEAAEADKGGHRAKAIRLVGQAIAETERGIRYDNRH